MNLKAITLAAAAAAVISTPSLAETKATGSGPNPFTDCGIGAALFQDVHWAAVTSNVIWDLGTTAVTSATASPETCSARKVQTAQFILDTYENLAEDTARGYGEHLTAAMNTFGCAADKQAIISMQLRQAMAHEVANPEYAEQSSHEKAQRYYQALDTASAGRCSA
ncbi:DUF3015 family protein [Marinobacterium weihaiense]|uniref:DUF3015 domain-containing protein n=1 Tax=Marinobacterium weihaiense TaxID=2851016 RepID=A0ABS6M9U5_9GAMM|nr:DUF3015 family protein [Marinobacterium weihaiense]MBV0933051.1 DUF3015 domain-containing protein [Marinobacterium weihaiense]